MNKKILNIVSSVKGAESLSTKLSDAILDRLQAAYPNSEILTKNLAATPFPHLERKHVDAFYTPSESHTDANKNAVQYSDEAIRELMEADIVVIGVPYYNFGIPSTLKAWIDHIVRVGVTFKYENGAPAGFVTNKKVYLSIASGAVYSEEMKNADFVEPYLRTILGFIGMTDIQVFRIEGTMMADTKEAAWPKTLSHVGAFAF